MSNNQYCAGGQTHNPEGIYRTIECKATRMLGIVTNITERQASEAALRAAEHLARGQRNALARTLDALVAESDPTGLLDHVLTTITAELDAHSVSVWRRNEQTGQVVFERSFEARMAGAERPPPPAAVDAALKPGDVWPWPQVVGTGKPYLLEDFRDGRAFPGRELVLALGVITILIVPMLVGGRVDGVMGIRFTRKRTFRPEEVELARALGNQAMLAMQLTRLSAKSRHAAIAAERNRFARDIHDTLTQGFTGIIVQLEAANDATLRGLTDEATARVRRACNLTRERLKEARRSVQALRPLAWTTAIWRRRWTYQATNICVGLVARAAPEHVY